MDILKEYESLHIHNRETTTFFQLCKKNAATISFGAISDNATEDSAEGNFLQFVSVNDAYITTAHKNTKRRHASNYEVSLFGHQGKCRKVNATTPWTESQKATRCKTLKPHQKNNLITTGTDGIKSNLWIQRQQLLVLFSHARLSQNDTRANR